jgi:hypothetical protein
MDEVIVILVELEVCKQYTDDDHGYYDHCQYHFTQCKDNFLKSRCGQWVLEHAIIEEIIHDRYGKNEIIMQLIAKMDSVTAFEYYLKFDP